MVMSFIKQELLNHGFIIKKNKQSMVIKEKEDIKRMKGWHVSNKEYCITLAHYKFLFTDTNHG